MKTIAAAVLLALVATATATSQPKPSWEMGKPADEKLVLHQRDFLRLLTHLNQEPLWEDQAKIAKEYQIQPENYKVPSVAEEYLQLERHGEFLPLEVPTSILDQHHVSQVKVLFELLYYSKDYDVFYKTALYLRNRVNQGLFVPAFYTAAWAHPDTLEIVLPPLYDVVPHLFVPSPAVQEVYDTRLEFSGVDTHLRQFVFPVNYTGFPNAHTPEQKVSYFTEDIGLNEFVAQFFYRYPYFVKADNYSSPNVELRGNVLYHTLRQLYARYVLERLSNGLPEPDPVDYEGVVKTSYNPRLRLHNGVELATRPANVYLRDVDIVTFERVRNAEYRLNEAVELGYVIKENEGRIKYKEVDATNFLGSLLLSDADSLHPRYYGALFRDLLTLFAKSSDVTHKYGVAASALGKYETLARDPVFFQIVKRVLNVFDEYKNNFPPYTKEQLGFPGLKIESADVDRLETYFERYEFEVDNLVREATTLEAEEPFLLVTQPRLNHKPFTYTIKVTSEKPVKAIFRVFFGPRFDAYGNDLPLDEARHYFVELDRFVYQVPAGETEVKRSSRDSPVLRADILPSAALFALVNRSVHGEGTFKPFGLRGYGFPGRLALPRGSRSGLPLRFYVIANPLDEETPAASVDKDTELAIEYGGSFREWFTTLADYQDVGFPFDRRIPHYYNFDVPNSYLKDVVVFHKTAEEINKTTA